METRLSWPSDISSRNNVQHSRTGPRKNLCNGSFPVVSKIQSLYESCCRLHSKLFREQSKDVLVRLPVWFPMTRSPGLKKNKIKEKEKKKKIIIIIIIIKLTTLIVVSEDILERESGVVRDGGTRAMLICFLVSPELRRKGESSSP